MLLEAEEEGAGEKQGSSVEDFPSVGRRQGLIMYLTRPSSLGKILGKWQKTRTGDLIPFHSQAGNGTNTTGPNPDRLVTELHTLAC